MILNVNGKSVDVAARPDTPLLYVLMNELRLKGPRFGCGLGQCGACTVHVEHHLDAMKVCKIGLGRLVVVED